MTQPVVMTENYVHLYKGKMRYCLLVYKNLCYCVLYCVGLIPCLLLLNMSVDISPHKQNFNLTIVKNTQRVTLFFGYGPPNRFFI